MYGGQEEKKIHDTPKHGLVHKTVYALFQVLDCVGLVVSGVTSKENGETLAYQVKHLEGELTPCIDITLPASCALK